jgi:hypothetical protein
VRYIYSRRANWEKARKRLSSKQTGGSMKTRALINNVRLKLHRDFLRNVFMVSPARIPSIADAGNATSIQIANEMLKQIGAVTKRKKLSDQTAGNRFEALCASFLEKTFLKLNHLRPGKWKIMCSSHGDGVDITKYEQYAHLSAVAKACESYPELLVKLGTDYLICPDIVIVRHPEPDAIINQPGPIVDDKNALLTGLRFTNRALPFIHASISCKLTLRNGHVQSARFEALNLIRNRKGRVPHIVVVTAEPLPSRLASLALGTGDIDCVYHFALPELRQAVDQTGHDDSKEMLRILIDGKRLRDISDLPLDLAI